jgi:hypothetical protein
MISQVFKGVVFTDYLNISQVHVFILSARKHIKFQEKILIETTFNTYRRLSSYSDTKNLSEVPSPFKLIS